MKVIEVKKFMKVLLKILITITVILSILIALFVYITEFRITNIARFVNEENNYKVIFQEVGEPDWPFGKMKVKVTLVNERNKKLKSFKDYIWDDGASASEGNIKVNWFNDYVEIVLMGDEQKDDIHKLKYK